MSIFFLAAFWLYVRRLRFLSMAIPRMYSSGYLKLSHSCIALLKFAKMSLFLTSQLLSQYEHCVGQFEYIFVGYCEKRSFFLYSQTRSVVFRREQDKNWIKLNWIYRLFLKRVWEVAEQPLVTVKNSQPSEAEASVYKQMLSSLEEKYMNYWYGIYRFS